MTGGIRMPARPALLRIREAIAAQPAALRAAHERPRIPAAIQRLSKEANLCRVPREFPPDHP